MNLIEGKMSTKELAQWFGIGYGSFRNKKKEKLAELLDYCQYEPVYGGVIISKIYVYEYIKPVPAYIFVKDHLDLHWHSSGYDTAARVGSEMYYTYKDKELKGLKESTIKNYVAKARIELYGHVYLKDRGTEGECHPAPVKANHWKEAELLTREEYELYLQCKKAIYYDEKLADLEIAHMSNQISDSEYEQAKQEHSKEWEDQKVERFFALKDMCTQRLGFCPDIVTKLEKNLYFEDAATEV